MRYYKIEVFQNGQWKLLKHWSRPLYKSNKLDGSFDFGRIELNAQEKTNIKPFQPLRITEYMDKAMTLEVKKMEVLTQSIPRQRVGF